MFVLFVPTTDVPHPLAAQAGVAAPALPELVPQRKAEIVPDQQPMTVQETEQIRLFALA